MSKTKMSVESKILDTKIKFTVSKLYEVAFTVNGECTRQSKNKIAITKWLLANLVEAKSHYTFLKCNPHKQDGFGEMRKEVFEKLGFVQLNANSNYLYWTNDSSLLPVLTLKDLEQVETVSEFANLLDCF